MPVVSHFSLFFTQGVGDELPVMVVVGGRASNNITFSYDAPIINAIVSSTPDANGATISFRGE